MFEPLPKPEGRVKNAKQKRWLKTRAQFLKGQRNHEGYYVCQRCTSWVTAVEIDHIRKRSLAPDRVFDPTNFRLLCHGCHLAVNPDYKNPIDNAGAYSI